MALEFYYNPMSRAAMTRVLLEELGVEYVVKPVAYDDGSMRSPEFLAINPMGKIPVIVDNGVVVTETVAIAIYLADKYKTPNDLAPAIDDPRRGEYLKWLVFQSSCIDPAMMQAGAKFEMDRMRASWGSVDLVVDVLKDRLAQADPFLFGDWFTAADAILGTAVGWATQFDMFPKEPALMDYVQRVAARPAFQRAMADMATAQA